MARVGWRHAWEVSGHGPGLMQRSAGALAVAGQQPPGALHPVLIRKRR